MIVHLISTGDEILLGDIVDTNSSYLCQAVREIGGFVRKTVSVGDDLDAISGEMKNASKHADICIVTGGLGPTQDDITAQAGAHAAGVDLKIDQSALKSIQSFFKKKGFTWSRVNEKQAMFPEGSIVIENDYGTAPGFYLPIRKCLFFFLPGPPKEMIPMFSNKVRSILTDKFDLNKSLIVERLTVFMLKESVLGEMLKPMNQLFPMLKLGIRVSFPTIEVKIWQENYNHMGHPDEGLLKKAKDWMLDQLGNKVVSRQGRTLAQEVGYLLTQKNKTLAIAESCTGGMISNMLTDISGSSEFFLFSGVTYSNEAKTAVLDVQQKTLIDHGAVHEQTALEMAIGARMKAGADIGVSTTGIAGPTGGTDQKPVGTVCIGLAAEGYSGSKTFVFKFDNRDRNKKIFAASALEMVRKHLMSI